MNYIKQLQMQVKEQKVYTEALNEGIVDLQMYLMTEKFWNDTTVQVQDIINRLHDIRRDAAYMLESFQQEEMLSSYTDGEYEALGEFNADLD